MSTFFYPITFVGANGRRETFDALVDTGSTFTSLPREALSSLGVRPQRSVSLRLANGQSHLQQIGNVIVELDDLEGPTYVVFGDDGSPPIIGALTLEGFLLGVDPVGQRLIPVEGWQA